jgi:hypothetical protein
MKRFLGAVFVAALVSALGGPARADDKDVKAVLDKAVKALGGEDKLAAAKAATWKTKGKVTFGGNDIDFTGSVTVQGLDHFRQENESEFMGNKVQRVTVLAGDKGWRKFGDMEMDLDKEGVANTKRTAYLQVIPVTLLPLREKGFKVEAAPEEKVGGKPAAVLKVTPPDGKDFTLSFDKETGLPVRMVAKVAGFRGGEFTEETTFADYKDMSGIKKATKIENKRDGNPFQKVEVTEFKILDKVDPKAFAKPG